ncbi:MAG: pantoate--beta-alanine ligase [Opitutaceae bacterium]
MTDPDGEHKPVRPFASTALAQVPNRPYRMGPRMKQVSSVSEMAALAAEMRSAGRTVALVPTLGAIHAGKAALVRAAADRADAVVVSLIVNPLQFGANESAAPYLRDPGGDLRACEEAGAAVAFTPPAGELLPKGFSTSVVEDTLSRPLCGQSRPAHFRGVATVTTKLLNLVRPDVVLFGQKTAQRAAVVRKVIEDLCGAAEVIVVPTVREPDGLAVGTANRSFTDSQRKEALALSQALFRAKEMVGSGTRSPDRLVAEVTHILAQHRRVRPIYVSVVDAATLEPTREVRPGADMLALAAWVDEARLIDNALL